MRLSRFLGGKSCFCAICGDETKSGGMWKGVLAEVCVCETCARDDLSWMAAIAADAAAESVDKDPKFYLAPLERFEKEYYYALVHALSRRLSEVWSDYVEADLARPKKKG